MTDIRNRSDRAAPSLELPHARPITVRLTGAGSLRRELEALLAEAPPDASPEDYRDLRTVQIGEGQRLQVTFEPVLAEDESDEDDDE